jgi:hypothetical protein
MLQAVYDDTGKPAPGIRVGMSGSGADAVGYWAGGTTNAQGKLLLKLPPGEYPITADPKGDLPYIRTQQILSVAKAPEEQPYELRMNPGCVLILEVVDEVTGKGVAQVPFGYSTEGDPEIWMSVYGDTGRIADHHTDANGRVRVVLAPGKRNFKAGWGKLPADYEAVPSDEDIRGPGTRAVDLPPGGTVTVKFKLRKK